MKNIWLSILKPKGSSAKWLIFLLLESILAMSAMGYLDIIKQYTDTPALSFEIGNYRINVYSVLKIVLIIGFIFWSAAIASHIAENRIGKFSRLRAANRALILKAI
jgi:small-conductance mechanosensitive channel